MKIDVILAGRLAYADALLLQEDLQQQRIGNNIPDTLLILEHPPVLTLGRRGDYANILVSREILKENGVLIYETDRGGDVTYHGPGQIVGYPVMDISFMGKDIKKYVHNIEEVFIQLLKKEFGISADRGEKKYTGVWVKEEKITAVGIAVRKYVTMHGFAFNVNTDLSHFNWITPCGITNRGVTSLEKILGIKVDFQKMNELVLAYFCEVFQLEPTIRNTNYAPSQA